MNLSTLIIMILAIAFVLTLAIGTIYQRHKSWVMSFLQNFTGVLFIISGFVKAIDPLGTSYKMQQYFAEFEATFADTSFSFLSSFFAWLDGYTTAIAIAMIVFEIMLGIMLLLGSRTKFTSWAFLLLVVFFTVLTGFTYLTGYVPSGVNFFSFGQWGAYNELQMKVTDCGCFGDFLKLEPKTSFLKDIVLLVPALYFVFRHQDMHQLFAEKTRRNIVWITTALVLLYCIRNTYWNIPHIDFRPFRSGVDIRAQKEAEEEAQGNREVISYTLKNALTGKFVELPYAQYLKEYKSYPKTDWEVIETEMTEPAVEETKISEFMIYGPDGEDVSQQVLDNPNTFLLFICHKLYEDGQEKVSKTVTDTIMRLDTIINGRDTTFEESASYVNRDVTVTSYQWNQRYLERFKQTVVPFAQSAKADGVSSIAVLGGADDRMIEDFREASGIDFTICTADDILLKTIVRSNPGVVLMRDGTILHKWHHTKLPSWINVKNSYMK